MNFAALLKDISRLEQINKEMQSIDDMSERKATEIIPQEEIKTAINQIIKEMKV